MNEPTRIAVDPPMQGAEYPRILYRDGTGEDHKHIDRPLLVQGKWLVDTLIVANLDDELVALDQGWRTTADPEGAPINEDARDAEIRRLREQLAESNAIEDAAPKRRGRPPLNREVTYGDAA